MDPNDGSTGNSGDKKDNVYKMKFGAKRPGKSRKGAAAGSFKQWLSDMQGNLDARDGQRRGLNVFLILLITLVIMFIFYFFTLPAINLRAAEFYTFLIIAIVVFNALNLFFGNLRIFRTIKYSVFLVIALLVIPALGNFFAQPLFRAKAYSRLITVEDASFADTVEEISYDKVPIVDRDAAAIIGDRQMGSVEEVVSQFDINDNYAQINVKSVPMRVSPLAYSDLVRYVINAKNGIPYYVSVDMATQDAELVDLEKPLFYSKSDLLMRNIHRHVRFQFPFLLFGETNFEVNDQEEGFYVTSVLTKRIGFFGGTDIMGGVVTDANTGESTYYDIEDIPMWVDRVQPSEIIINQLDYRGMYGGGFFNSVIGQRNVTRTTAGYNYVPLNDDIYLFTGVTSIRGDASNLGFYFVNMRTKEAKFFSVPSADEVSAMQSAAGQVQEKNYQPTFPILLNIKNRPTYLIGLKDNSGLAKMFALVDAENYQTVIAGDSVLQIMNELNMRTDTTGQPNQDSLEKTITIQEIQSVVVDGNTLYYIRAEGDELIYTGTAKELGGAIVFLKIGDSITVFGNETIGMFDILEIRE